MGSVEIDLGRMRGALFMRHDLPRCDWDVVGQWINDHVPAEQRPEIWPQVLRQWLWRMRNTLGAPYHIEESERVLLLTGMDRIGTRETLRLCEQNLDTIEHFLPGVVAGHPHGKQVVLCFDGPGQLRQYMMYYPDIPDWAIGVCIHQGTVHVAVEAYSPGFEDTLVHELTHACLSHRELPRWLNEAMAERMAMIVVARTDVIRYGELSETARYYWREWGFDEFLSGESFRRDGKLARDSYALALYLLERICRCENADLRGFLLDADSQDGGRAAAEEHVGRSLESMAQEVLDDGHRSDGVRIMQRKYFGEKKWW